MTTSNDTKIVESARPVQKAARPIDTVRGLLEKSREQIAMALPRHLTPDRIIRVALTSIQKTPELLACDPVSLVAGVLTASQLGLEIDGVLGHAYLVPFDNKKARRKEAQLIVGYKGYLALARRSGEVEHFSAHVVREGDHFEYVYGTSAYLKHVPSLEGQGRPLAVYAVLRLKDGGHDFEIIPWSRVLQMQQKYARKGQGGQLYGTWVDHLEEMARKSAIRALAKRCPVSVEIQQAVHHDTLAEGEVPSYAAGSALDAGLSRADQLAARLQSQQAAALPAPEEETPPGEDIDQAERDAIAGEGQGEPAP